MKVLCKNMERKEFSVDLEPSDTLDTLMKKLQEIHNIDREKSTLIFSGIIHQDLSKTLATIGFKENDWFVLYNKKLKPASIATPVAEPVPTATPVPVVSVPNTATSSISEGSRKLPPPQAGATQRVKISQEAVQSLLQILLNDPNCSRLLNENPQLLTRIQEPAVLVNLANMVGLDLSRFVRKADDEEEDVEPKISDTIWPSPSYTVPIMPVPPRPSRETAQAGQGGRQVVRLTAAESRILNKIKADLMDILGELPANINEYQINTIIYECYIAADKDPEAALNILIDHMLDQGDQADLGLGSFVAQSNNNPNDVTDDVAERNSSENQSAENSDPSGSSGSSGSSGEEDEADETDSVG